MNMAGLFRAQGQVIAAQAELNWIPQRRAANDLNPGTVAEPHFQQSSPYVGVAAHSKHASLASNAQGVECADVRRAAMGARRESASFLHNLTTDGWLV